MLSLDFVLGAGGKEKKARKRIGGRDQRGGRYARMTCGRSISPERMVVEQRPDEVQRGDIDTSDAGQGT